ncbi:response regulator transcription factor [Neobacillus niacini]|uniref:response regulator transcription factor n=1 Tax=Neobacillus niacini TaxID=86668 RepID=UPI003B02D853
MLKVLLVDDEMLTIRMLQSLIDWEKFNLELVGYAQDGVEAYEALLKYEPHIVITDINMPNMTGIEFIKKAKTLNRQTEFILVSAYSDFSYIQKAMKLGCTDYILKPIDELELDDALKKATDKIRGEKEKEHMLEKSEFQIKKMELHSFMRTGKDIQRIQKVQEHFSFHFDNYYLLILQLNHRTIDEYVNMHQIEFLQMSYINHILEVILKEYEHVLFEYVEDSWVILLSNIAPDTRIALSQEMIQALHTHFNLNVMACFSDVIHGINPLPFEYKRTKLLCRYNFYVDAEDILGFGYNCKEEDFTQIKGIDLVKEIEETLVEKDLGRAEKIINEIFYLSKNINPLELHQIYEICFQIIMKLKSLILQSHDKNETMNDLLNVSYESLLELTNVRRLKEFMLNALIETLKHGQDEKKTYSHLVTEAIEIIRKNYNRNITLEEICNQIAVSKNYFSYLFKREVGITLWNYLTELRLEKAKQLLIETDMKSYEISFQVGYENPSYFSMLFKKSESMTPNEYRRVKK